MAKRKLNKNQIIILLVFLALVLGGGGFYLASKKEAKESKTQENTIEENKGLTKEEIQDKEKKTETKSQEVPKTNVAPEGQISEEEKRARSVVQDFETAYKSKDKDKIFTYFTEPQTAQDKDTKERLMKGVDSAGNVGGPTLFETRSASEVPVSFEFGEVKKDGSNYVIKVKENRGSVTRDRILTLVFSNDWLIDKYENLEYQGKYTGFLNF